MSLYLCKINPVNKKSRLYIYKAKRHIVQLIDQLNIKLKSSVDLLWTAPEILTNPDQYPKGSKEGDVYGFGIILHEIFYRMGPFGGNEHTTAKGKAE